MTKNELIGALQPYDNSKTVLVQHGGIKSPAHSVVEVSYCKALRDGYDGSDVCEIGHDAESKKCSGCRFKEYGQCKQTNGIGQYMTHALLIVGEASSMPSTGSTGSGSSGSAYYKSNFAARQEVLKQEGRSD